MRVHAPLERDVRVHDAYHHQPQHHRHRERPQQDDKLRVPLVLVQVVVVLGGERGSQKHLPPLTGLSTCGLSSPPGKSGPSVRRLRTLITRRGMRMNLPMCLPTKLLGAR